MCVCVHVCVYVVCIYISAFVCGGACLCGVSVFVCEQVQSKRTGVHYTVSKQQPEHSQECMEVVEAMEWLLATKDGHFTTPWM